MLELCTSGCGWSVHQNIRWGLEKPHRMSWGVKVLTVSEQWIHKWKENMFEVLNKPSCIIFSVIDLSCMYGVFHQAFLCNTLFMRCKFYNHSDMDHKTMRFWAQSMNSVCVIFCYPDNVDGICSPLHMCSQVHLISILINHLSSLVFVYSHIFIIPLGVHHLWHQQFMTSISFQKLLHLVGFMNHSENYLSVVSCPLFRRFFFLQSRFLIVFNLSLVASSDLRSSDWYYKSPLHIQALLSTALRLQTVDGKSHQFQAFLSGGSRPFATLPICWYSLVSKSFYWASFCAVGTWKCCLPKLSTCKIYMRTVVVGVGFVLICAKVWILSQWSLLDGCVQASWLLWSASSGRKSWRLQIDITNLLFTTCNFWALL